MKLGIFSTEFWKIMKYQISLKYVECEPSYSMLADGKTDGQIWGMKQSLFTILRPRLKCLKLSRLFYKFFAFSVTSQHILFTGYGWMMCLGKRDGEISRSIKEGNLLTWWVNNSFYHTSEFVFLARALCFTDWCFNSWGNSFTCIEYYFPFLLLALIRSYEV